jgi:peptidyl-prolyl cis-trans isomerase B (cyclophilin B)
MAARHHPSPTIGAVLTRLAAGAAALVLVPTLAACGGNSSSTTAADPGSSTSPTTSTSPSSGSTGCDYQSDPQGAAKKVSPPPSKPTVHGTVKVTMDTTVGVLKASLDATNAPCTVNSFLSLAKQGYFDNTPCHRLTTRGIYVLQCGDPTGTGTGGPGYTLPDELTGQETYGAGVLAMANTGQPHTGGSQFFIVYKDSSSGLQKLYTVFGKLDTSGVKAIRKVAAKGTDNSNGPGDGHPKVKVDITKVTQH